MNPTSKRAFVAALLLALFVGGGLLYRVFMADDANAVANGPARQQPAVPVIGGVVVQKDMPVLLSAIGTVQPEHSVAVRTRLDSQVGEVFVEDGQRVEAGQLLFELDARQLEAQRRQAEAVLARDEAQLAHARRNLERRKPQLSSEAEIDAARTSVAALEAAVQADRASLQNLAVQLSYSRIVAPIAGRLGTIASKAGSTVKPGDPQPLVTIVQLQPVYVAFSVPQARLGPIQASLAAGPVGVTARVPGMAGAPEHGRLAYVENTVDVATSTLSVKALFPNAQERLWPGSYVNVEATLRTEPGALVAPARAVQMGQSGPYVFVIRDDGSVETRAVTVDRTVGDEAVIAAGLRRGERIVVEGQLRLVNGARVEVQGARQGGER